MAYIRIDIEGALMDGHEVSFKAPCDCTEINDFKVYYIQDGEQKNKTFTMKDTHGNALAGLGNLFKKNAYVKAILDVPNRIAYLQNSDTNAYLEEKFEELAQRMIDLTAGLVMRSTTEETLVLSTGHTSIIPQMVSDIEGYTRVCVGIQTNTTGDIGVNAWTPNGAIRVYNRTGSEKEVKFTFHWLYYKDL